MGSRNDHDRAKMELHARTKHKTEGDPDGNQRTR